MQNELLHVEGLSKSFGAHTVLDGVDLTVRSGEIVGLLGPNGSGKSTMLNAISGFMPIDGGSVTMDGARLSGLPAHKVARNGLVRTFQLPSMPTRMTVREVLQAGDSEPARVSAMLTPLKPAEQVEELLEQFRLTNVADQPASSLSGGQKKLLSVAMALRGQPKLLCLDEPTAGVHPELRTEMIRILRAFNARGVTLLVVEHDMLFIRQLCSRCVVLDRGTLIADCAPEELEDNPRVVEAYLGKAVKKGKTVR